MGNFEDVLLALNNNTADREILMRKTGRKDKILEAIAEALEKRLRELCPHPELTADGAKCAVCYIKL